MPSRLPLIFFTHACSWRLPEDDADEDLASEESEGDEEPTYGLDEAGDEEWALMIRHPKLAGVPSGRAKGRKYMKRPGQKDDEAETRSRSKL